MTTDLLRDALQRRPFMPFVIRQADGRETRVTHPEAMAYGGGLIAEYVQEDGRFEVIDLLPVPTLLIDAPAAPKRRKGGGYWYP
jgi:hypothetical protein